jgi:monofunctional biosynthetic peptidoglycan transglycosylase
MVKNVFLSSNKTITRKLKEAVLAMRVERQLTKTRILEVYLNVIEFGEGLYGIGPASRRYFGKHPSQLTPKEGAFLAMLLPSPKKYSVSFRKRELTPYARSIIRSILGKLRATNRLNEGDYHLALATPLSFEANPVVMAPEQRPGYEETLSEEAVSEAVGAVPSAPPESEVGATEPMTEDAEAAPNSLPLETEVVEDEIPADPVPASSDGI